MLGERGLEPRDLYRQNIHNFKYTYNIGSSNQFILIEETNMNGRARYRIRVEGAKYGASFGTALAIAISYTANHSILWAIIHGFFSWLYVIYFALFRV